MGQRSSFQFTAVSDLTAWETIRDERFDPRCPQGGQLALDMKFVEPMREAGLRVRREVAYSRP